MTFLSKEFQMVRAKVYILAPMKIFFPVILYYISRYLKKKKKRLNGILI